MTFGERSRTWAVLLLTPLLLFTGCQERSSGGQIKATPAYVDHFGPPPTPEEGSCFARVGYFPTVTDPTRIVPVPLFLFAEQNQLRLLLERLIRFEHFAPLGEGLFNPFPKGTSLTSVSRTDGEVTVELQLPRTLSEDESVGLVRSVALTAGQFEGVDRVAVRGGGKGLAGMPQGGIVPERNWAADPGSPRPLVVVGNWEADLLKEILIDFDRPVTLERLEVKDEGGRPVRGEHFLSAFDMAVVVHPDLPASLSEGMQLTVSWAVVDRHGRRGEGEESFRLLRHTP